MIYTACLKGAEDTIYNFGRGSSIKAALYEFKASGALDELKKKMEVELIDVGVYETVEFDDDLSDEELGMMEHEGCSFIIRDLVHEVKL
jgi:hypothetical protein